MAHWLLKSEPGEFSIDDLESRPDQLAPWDGVRNYQARNMIRDDMRIGDRIFFYHSNCETPAIVGIARVASKAYPDPTAFDSGDKHFDPRSDPENPRWYAVDVKLMRRLRRAIPLRELKTHGRLAGMPLLRRGNRLSVMPVTKAQWDYILGLEKKSPS